MKILFAVSNENVSEAIVKNYQKKYGETVTYKNVFYFNAILKEIQKDKSYDRVIISEDLEPFSNNNYDTIDKFIYEKLDSISLEIGDIEDKQIPIILICTDRRTKSGSIILKLFEIGIYNALIGQDRTVEQVCNLIKNPRTKEEAKQYYKLDFDDPNKTNKDDVSELEVQNILIHYKRLGRNEERYADSFNNIAAQYTDNQLKIIIKYLPIHVKAVLEAECPKYQELVTYANNPESAKEKRAKERLKAQKQREEEEKLKKLKSDNVDKNRYKPNDEVKTGLAIDLIENKKKEPAITGNVIIPNSINANQPTKIISPEELEKEDKNIIQPIKDDNEEVELNDVNNNVEPEVVSADNSIVEPQQEQVKKGRGRPRKYPVSNEPPKPKGKRGRPRKNPLPESEEEIDNTTLPGLEEKENTDLPEFEEIETTSIPTSENEETVTLPGFDEEETVELPGFEEIETTSIPTSEEKESVNLPGFEEEEKEDTVSLPGFEEVETTPIPTSEEKENVTLPGFDEEENTSLPGFEEEQSTGLPGFDEIETPNNPSSQPIQTNYVPRKIQNNYEDKSIEKTENQKVYSSDSLNNLITKDKKVVAFVGTSKNGTSFLVNNLATLFSSIGIKTAILDMTKNRNSYYIFTNNDENLRKIAYSSLEKLENGIPEGIKVDRNLTVYTSVPGDGREYTNSDAILSTLVQNESLVLIDCDFDTPLGYFANAQEIYLVQSMDILTIQPLTAFLRELKTKGILKEEKLRAVINKEIKVKDLNAKMIIGGMSFYNDPEMSFMTELFDKDRIKACTIAFEDEIYSSYLEVLLKCNINISKYSKSFINSLKVLANMVYPLLSKQTYGKHSTDYAKNNFSDEMNNTLNQMKNKY